MRIGIVAYWFNRGQAVVARQIRATLDELGHETFVLARPTRKSNIRPGWVDTEGVWAQEGVTTASDYLIPAAEYTAWAEAVQPDLVMFDQNYQFDEIAQLRRSGVRTIGRFVWEHFSAEHVDPASAAFDRIYSLTACEQQRYTELGIETPRVRWGCFPDLVQLAKQLEAEGGADSPAPPQGEAREVAVIQAPPQLASEPTGPDAKRSIPAELSTACFRVGSCRSASRSPRRSRPSGRPPTGASASASRRRSTGRPSRSRG